MEQGWICGRCHKSNAPWVRSCDCMAMPVPPAIPEPTRTDTPLPPLPQIYCGHVNFVKFGGGLLDDIPRAILERAKTYL